MIRAPRLLRVNCSIGNTLRMRENLSNPFIGSAPEHKVRLQGRKRSARLLSWTAPLLAMALTSVPVHGENDRPPLDAAAALAALAKLESAYNQSLDEQRKEATVALQQAMASPSAAGRLYESAIESTGGPDFSDWKKRNSEILRDKTFQEAVQIHLRYLLMSLERGRSEDAVGWAGPSLQYARDLADWMDRKESREPLGPARDILDRPLGEGPFVRWLRLGLFLPSGEAWEQSPGNLGGILEKNVRAPWRAEGDPQLDAAWQLELEAGAARATANGERAAEEFNTHTAPSLQFRRARDRAAIGQPNRAAADIFELARNHPDHPDFPQWAATLREMLQSQTVPQESAASSSGDL
jgi:hypothetical protein